MLVKQVNRLDFEPFERSLNHSFDAFRLAGHTTLLAAVAIESELRGNDYLPTERGECFAHEFLVGERAIDFGGVEEADALFHGCTDDVDHLLFVAGWPVSEAHAHTTQTNGRD